MVLFMAPIVAIPLVPQPRYQAAEPYPEDDRSRQEDEAGYDSWVRLRAGLRRS